MFYFSNEVAMASSSQERALAAADAAVELAGAISTTNSKLTPLREKYPDRFKAKYAELYKNTCKVLLDDHFSGEAWDRTASGAPIKDSIVRAICLRDLQEHEHQQAAEAAIEPTAALLKTTEDLCLRYPPQAAAARAGASKMASAALHAAIGPTDLATLESKAVANLRHFYVRSRLRRFEVLRASAGADSDDASLFVSSLKADFLAVADSDKRSAMVVNLKEKYDKSSEEDLRRLVGDTLSKFVPCTKEYLVQWLVLRDVREYEDFLPQEQVDLTLESTRDTPPSRSSAPTSSRAKRRRLDGDLATAGEADNPAVATAKQFLRMFQGRATSSLSADEERAIKDAELVLQQQASASTLSPSGLPEPPGAPPTSTPSTAWHGQNGPGGGAGASWSATAFSYPASGGAGGPAAASAARAGAGAGRASSPSPHVPGTVTGFVGDRTPALVDGFRLPSDKPNTFIDRMAMLQGTRDSSGALTLSLAPDPDSTMGDPAALVDEPQIDLLPHVFVEDSGLVARISKQVYLHSPSPPPSRSGASREYGFANSDDFLRHVDQWIMDYMQRLLALSVGDKERYGDVMQRAHAGPTSSRPGGGLWGLFALKRLATAMSAGTSTDNALARAQAWASSNRLLVSLLQRWRAFGYYKKLELEDQFVSQNNKVVFCNRCFSVGHVQAFCRQKSTGLDAKSGSDAKKASGSPPPPQPSKRVAFKLQRGGQQQKKQGQR